MHRVPYCTTAASTGSTAPPHTGAEATDSNRQQQPVESETPIDAAGPNQALLLQSPLLRE